MVLNPAVTARERERRLLPFLAREAPDPNIHRALLLERADLCAAQPIADGRRMLRRYIDQRDAGSAGGQAHSIRGAAANVGGMALSAVALAMEKAAKAGHPEEIASLVPELERQFESLKTRMRKDKS